MDKNYTIRKVSLFLSPFTFGLIIKKASSRGTLETQKGKSNILSEMIDKVVSGELSYKDGSKYFDDVK